jgi:hypothetical protein
MIERKFQETKGYPMASFGPDFGSNHFEIIYQYLTRARQRLRTGFEILDLHLLHAILQVKKIEPKLFDIEDAYRLRGKGIRWNVDPYLSSDCLRGREVA